MKVFPLFFLFLTTSLIAQDKDYEKWEYYPLVEQGLITLESEKYDSCIIYYKTAFLIRQTSYLSTLRAAACAHSAGDETYREAQLDKAFSLSWEGTKEMWDNGKEFDYLRGTEFENKILSKYQHSLDTTSIDIALMQEFKVIKKTDQQYRGEMRPIAEKYGWQSPQMDSLWRLQNPIDSANTVRISGIIDSIGYPGKSVVGAGQASVGFFVIQHAELATQEKYLDVITKAADAREVNWRNVALLVDRVENSNGRPQIYGSQVGRDEEKGSYYFGKIAEPYKVDSLRATVGLGPLQAYADRYNFVWDPEGHIKYHKEKAAKLKEEVKEKDK